MAVIIQTNPDLYTPSDNPIVWTFSSDETAQTNFSYIVEVYVDGVLDSNHQVFPEVGIYAHFDASKKMTAKVQPQVLGQTTVTNDAGNNREIYIKVFERYGTTPSNQSSATSSAITAFKASLSPVNMQNWDYSRYNISDVNKLFLTYLTDNISIKTNSDYYLSIITNAESNLSVEINFKDINGSVVATYSEPIDSSIKIVQLMVNVDKLVSDGSITQGEADLTNSVELLIRQGFNEASEYKVFNIDRECSNRGRHLIWLNHLGGFDQFSFSHNAMESGTTKRKKYSKQFGNWSGNEFVLDANNSGDIEYIVTTDTSIQLVSDWLTQSVQNWLVQSVFDGVSVHLQPSLLTYSRVAVDTNSYKLEQDFFEELFNVIIQLKLSNSRNSPKI